MMTEQVILYESDEAASYRTDIKGWVSRTGMYYGDDSGSESAARYEGCTHHKCRDCDKLTERQWLICQSCVDLREEARYLAMPEAEWDGYAWLYSDCLDRYFANPDDADDYIVNSLEGKTLADLRLVICKPNFVRPLESDYCCDEIPEDGDLDDDVQKAMDDFNKAVHGIILSWSPGKTRLKIDKEKP